MPPRLPLPLFSASSICPRCVSRVYSSTSTPLPPPPPARGAARLPSRRLLAVHGPDSTSFLHGITTNQVKDGLTSGFYSGFLTAQGRVLHDVFIYPASHSKPYLEWLASQPALGKYGTDQHTASWIIEVDAAYVSKLLSYLKKYKLRAKLGLQVLEPDEWGVWSLWDEGRSWTQHPAAANDGLVGGESAAAMGLGEGVLGAFDSRAPGMGKRVLFRGRQAQDEFLAREEVEAMHGGEEAYTLRRYLRGVPEGQREIRYESSLPQESDMDFMGGIDFRKGCYVGQELTIRTHHTGVVRKRILPVRLYSGSDEAVPRALEYDSTQDLAKDVEGGTNVMPAKGGKGRSAGKWLAGVGNVGLGLVRVEMMTDLVLTTEGASPGWREEDEWAVGGTGIRAFVPEWVRSQIKVKKEMRRV